MGSFSIGHWIVVLLIVVLIFGTKKLRNMGGDLGSAVKEFKKGLADTEDAPKLEADKATAERANSEKAAQPERDKTV